jgi:HAD superfamily hydrolase (TIGR01549 family)
MVPRPAATFDLWHTLLYLEPDAEAAYLSGQFDAAVRVLEESRELPGAPARTPAELRAAFDVELRRAVEASHEGITVTPAEQMRRAARALGRDARPEDYEAALGEVIRRTRFSVAPSAHEALAGVRNLGLGVGIVSNTVGEPGRFLRARLSELGFDRDVEVYTFSDELPWTKPAPEIFRATLEKLGSVPGRAAHVGDSWADLEGARRAGLRAGIHYVGLQRYAPEYQSLNYAPPIDRRLIDEEVHDLAEVVPILARRLKGDSAWGPLDP